LCYKDSYGRCDDSQYKCRDLKAQYARMPLYCSLRHRLCRLRAHIADGLVQQPCFVNESADEVEGSDVQFERGGHRSNYGRSLCGIVGSVSGFACGFAVCKAFHVTDHVVSSVRLLLIGDGRQVFRVGVVKVGGKAGRSDRAKMLAGSERGNHAG
jgi:hypothetical protein